MGVTFHQTEHRDIKLVKELRIWLILGITMMMMVLVAFLTLNARSYLTLKYYTPLVNTRSSDMDTSPISFGNSQNVVLGPSVQKSYNSYTCGGGASTCNSVCVSIWEVRCQTDL